MLRAAQFLLVQGYVCVYGKECKLVLHELKLLSVLGGFESVNVRELEGERLERACATLPSGVCFFPHVFRVEASSVVWRSWEIRKDEGKRVTLEGKEAVFLPRQKTD